MRFLVFARMSVTSTFNSGVGPHVDLIWCNDFAKALSDRQSARQQEALQRAQQQREQEEGDGADSAVTSGTRH